MGALLLHSALLGRSSHSTCASTCEPLLVRKGLLAPLGSARACALCSEWDDTTSDKTALRTSSWASHQGI